MLYGESTRAGGCRSPSRRTKLRGPPPALAVPQLYPSDGVECYDEGLEVGYRWWDTHGQAPLFPFGYGLSYEQFQGARVSRPMTARRGEAVVAAAVRNVSQRPGPATLELYLESPSRRRGAAQAAQGLRPTWNTTARARAGSVFFRSAARRSGLLQPEKRRHLGRGPQGRYTVLVGTSSTDLDHVASFQVGA